MSERMQYPRPGDSHPDPAPEGERCICKPDSPWADLDCPVHSEFADATPLTSHDPPSAVKEAFAAILKATDDPAITGPALQIVDAHREALARATRAETEADAADKVILDLRRELAELRERLRSEAERENRHADETRGQEVEDVAISSCHRGRAQAYSTAAGWIELED